MRGSGLKGVGAVAVVVSACTVGPDYQRPDAPVPAQYKEAGWKVGEPLDAIDRGAWWSVYKDPLLDDLQKQIDISNQNLKAAAAAFEQAEWIVAQARAAFFPTVDLNASAQRSRTGGGSSSSTGAGRSGFTSSSFSTSASASGCRISGVRSAVPLKAMWRAPRRVPAILPVRAFRRKVCSPATICSLGCRTS